MEARLLAAGRAQLPIGAAVMERIVILPGTYVMRRGKALTSQKLTASGQVTCLNIPVARVKTYAVDSRGSWLLWLLALERAVYPVG